MLKKLLALLALCLIALPFVVAAQAPGDVSTLCAFLSWAGTIAGLTIILGFLEVKLVEYLPQWPGILSKWKRPILFVIALVLSLLILAAKAYLCGLVIDIQVAWDALIAACGVFTVGQLWHGRILEGSRSSRVVEARLKGLDRNSPA